MASPPASQHSQARGCSPPGTCGSPGRALLLSSQEFLLKRAADVAEALYSAPRAPAPLGPLAPSHPHPAVVGINAFSSPLAIAVGDATPGPEPGKSCCLSHRPQRPDGPCPARSAPLMAAPLQATRAAAAARLPVGSRPAPAHSKAATAAASARASAATRHQAWPASACPGPLASSMVPRPPHPLPVSVPCPRRERPGRQGSGWGLSPARSKLVLAKCPVPVS